MSIRRPIGVGLAAGLLSLACVGPVTDETPSVGLHVGTADGEWRVHQADNAASHYSALDQIDAQNVDQLHVAWRWTTIDEKLREADEDLRRISRIYELAES